MYVCRFVKEMSGLCHKTFHHIECQSFSFHKRSVLLRVVVVNRGICRRQISLADLRTVCPLIDSRVTPITDRY
jgi:hypothetical protein